MNIEGLAGVLPVRPQSWTSQQVCQWLHFVGLSQFEDSFIEHQVDGTRLLKLRQDHQLASMSIPSSIARKKLARWLREGLHKLDRVLRCGEKSMAKQSLLLRSAQYIDSFVLLSSSITTVGRHPRSVLLLEDRSVSKRHAVINCVQSHYFVRDLGSSGGTFLRVTGETEIEEGMLLEVGSLQLQAVMEGQQKRVLKLSRQKEESSLQIRLEEGQSASIGRSADNTFSFERDSHLSAHHCRVSMRSGGFFLQDLNSLNGCWVRLSPPGVSSQPRQLNEESVVRFGTVSSFYCKTVAKEGGKVEEHAGQDLCLCCAKQTRDSVFSPCGHSLCCVECSDRVRRCPACELPISQSTRIYVC